MPRDVRVSIAALRAAYPDLSRSTAQIAAAFGMSARTLQKIAKAQGWPPRPIRRISSNLSAERIRPLWNRGLCARDIGIILGASQSAVQAYAIRYGMRRPHGWRPTLTLAEWREEQIARAWAKERRAA